MNARRGIITATILSSALLLLWASPARALSITVELGDCRMPLAINTTCEPLGDGIPDNALVPAGDPLWIDFTLDGEPMAHLVAHSTTAWSFTFGYDGVVSGSSELVLTDMGGPIGDPIGGTCQLGLCVYNVVLPTDTFIHDLHIEPVVGSLDVVFNYLEIGTNDPHEKGLWVPEPGMSGLLGLGLAGLGVLRRSGRK